jgi:predicted regulator of Ras-like GTPase activity (Roadblock/LC7/MglB family)
MEVVLQQISMTPGVLGCFICNGEGRPLARSFPATFDPEILKRAAALLPEIAGALHGQTDNTTLVDLRYDVGRILIKKLPEGFLALLCSQSINVQFLSISLNVAQNKISSLGRIRQPQPDLEPVTIQQPVTVQQLHKVGNIVILAIDSMNVSAKIKWNQMEENVAISTNLAQELQLMFNIGPFKKIKLVNKSSGSSKTLALITFERDGNQIFDDKLVLTLAAAEALKAKPGDEIAAEPIQGGFFRWT